VLVALAREGDELGVVLELQQRRTASEEPASLCVC